VGEGQARTETQETNPTGTQHKLVLAVQTQSTMMHAPLQRTLLGCMRPGAAPKEGKHAADTDTDADTDTAWVAE
jgi:hypothetical protein